MKLPSFSLAKLKTIKKRYIILGIIGIFILFSIIKNAVTPDDSKEFFTVEEGRVSETIILAGDIDMEDRVDLGFGISGRVSEVLVEQGESVKKGQTLARLSMNQLQAELLEAEAGLRQAQADNSATTVDLEYSYQNLQNVVDQQDTIVANAYRALLNESLEAYALEDTDAVAPVISGTYLGSEEGDYLLSVYNSGSTSGYSFNIRGLETGFGPALTTNPGPLGTQGLYIQFDEDSSYGRTDWVVSIPNKRSSNYTAKKNAYDQAVADRAAVIANAEDAYLQAEALGPGNNTISRGDAGVIAARARIDAVRAGMSDGVITAPFDGVVGLLDLSVGEIVSANTSYVTLVGSEQFELSLDVPEIDVAKLAIGDEVSITLDAYMDGSTWRGVINAIDVIDTLVDGVPVYKTKVIITQPDPRIRVGMSAKASILAEEKEDVVRAPRYFFERTEFGYEAKVQGEKKDETRQVVLGLEGNDGFVEVLEGLKVGEVLVRTKDQ